MQKRLNYMDGIRGLAICGVVLIHVGLATPGLPAAISSFASYGYRGVSLFFILSALLLASVSQGRQLDVSSFYMRRFFRVAPMFYFGIIAYSLSPFAMGSHATIADIGLTSAFLHGFAPLTLNDAMPGAWSIAAEMIFYALFPLFILIVTNFRRAIAFLAFSYALALAFRLIAKVALAGLFPKEVLSEFLHFAFPAYLPAFAWGFVLFHVLKSDWIRRVAPWQGHVLVAGSLAAMTIAGLSGSSLLTNSQVAPPLQAALVLGAAISGSRIFDNPVMRHIGVVSFSMYVVHWSIVQAVTPAIGAMEGSPVFKLAVSYVAVLGASVAVSTITYLWIERPAVALGRRLSQRRPEAVELAA